jgi:SAM-dependent methyltransferase
VYALEPDPSDEIGRGAIHRIRGGLPIRILAAKGEAIPLADAHMDIVYARQVLHHARDLFQMVAECTRVLKPGGLFLASREHVVDNQKQLDLFLSSHPVHKLVGGEHAYPLGTYVQAFRQGGLRLERTIGPWDAVMNAYPAVRSHEELLQAPRVLLRRRFGIIGVLASGLPGISYLVWRRLKRRAPGRLYSFFCIKA